ncbi:diguanylate cyclase (GGDEF)-like protein [Litorivivens lipolytica]|uniref:Diguanylate cyclase (GGDEF)-like protein n=1 Tax=Litorivivens lipolytica TaxID=1524264 RepID=A0A7W4W2M8_9GAMM|nr:diguanylate cyclase [Litorivivens lipolytica]MBB3046313.1 diguanylate cyclase (GGDEF)-like protein [Litorivivens lipolytica]
MNFWRFNLEDSSLGNQVLGTYDPILVAISVAIAALAGITVLALADRITASPDRSTKAWWHVGGAVALACGIWSMHFTGMLAFELPGHPAMNYDAGLTLISVFPAFLASMAALHFITKSELKGFHRQMAALLLAAGIGTMHYTGMEAMLMPGLRYDFALFVLSIVVAHLLALIALTTRIKLRATKSMPENAVNLIAGVVIGGSIAGMHYTAMASSKFFLTTNTHVPSSQFSDNTLALGICIFAAVTLGLSILATWIDRQVGFQRLLHLERMAHTDALTGLPNRVLYDNQLQTALEQNKRSQDGYFALLYFDLNKFKPINDTYGHAAGDLLLREFAVRLKKSLRETDLPARLGGDEFAAIVRDFGTRSDLVLLIERIQAAMKKPVVLGRISLSIEVSIGVSRYPHNGDTPQQLIQAADDAMYQAKSSQQPYCFATKPHLSAVKNPINNGADLNNISIRYLPSFDLKSGNLVGATCLPVSLDSQGNVDDATAPNLPADALIDKIGETLVEDTAYWRNEGARVPPVAIPLTREQLEALEPADISAFCEKTGISPDNLALEIPASVFAIQQESTKKSLQQLEKTGTRRIISYVDNSSSLQSLSDARANCVKLSPDFVKQALASEHAKTLLKTIVILGREFNFEVSCAGVSNELEMQALREVGCSSAQGDFLHAPTSRESIAELVKKASGQVSVIGGAQE